MINPRYVRYIKLGEGGCWEDTSLERGELHFGYQAVPHEVALTLDSERIKYQLVLNGRNPRAAAADAREIIDFYSLEDDCLWVTCAHEHLWWTFAYPEVRWLGQQSLEQGLRCRTSINGWSNLDITGRALWLDQLSTLLTRVAGYRRTICKVEAEEYLLRKINGLPEPLIDQAMTVRTALLDVVEQAITRLHSKDFETLVDVIFARSGWHRVSAIGGIEKLKDLVLEQSTTGERAMVQVKSNASQTVLEDYVADFDQAGIWDRLFFVCHSPRGTLRVPDEHEDVHLWSGPTLAAIVVRLGLTDWVLERVA